MTPDRSGSVRRGLIALAAVLALAACSGSSDSDADTTSTVSTAPDDESPVFIPSGPTLASCLDGAEASLPDWPFDAGQMFAPTDFDDDGLTYRVVGVTNDADRTIVAAMDTVFADFDAAEPTGGATDISIQFTAPVGTVDVDLADDDTDGCWDVEVVAEYLETPPVAPVATFDVPQADDQDDDGPSDTRADDGQTDGDLDDDQPIGDDEDPGTVNSGPDDPLDDLATVGNGEIISARGSFPLRLTTCSTAPVEIVGQADVGSLEIVQNLDETITVSWTYTDSVKILDADARTLTLTGSSASFVADGENDEGPETLLIDVVCSLT